MTRLLATAISAMFLVAAACAQSTTTSTTTNTDNSESLADRLPRENVTSSALHARSPGNWVRAALSRTGLPDNSNSGSGSSSSSGSSGSSSSSSGLNGILSSVLGGSGGSTAGLSGILSSVMSSGGTSGLSDLLGNITGSGSSGAIQPSNAAVRTPTTSNAGGTQASSLADLIALRDQAAAQQKTATRQQTSGNRPTGGAFDRLPGVSSKADSRSQTQQQTTDDRRFVVRLGDSLLGTFFTFMTTALLFQNVVDEIKDILRPVFDTFRGTTVAPAATDAGGNTGGTGDNGSRI